MKLITGIVAVLGVVHLAEDPGYERGLTLRVWDVGRPMDFLAEIAPDQTPNVDRRVGGVNFTNATDFGSPPDYFVVELSGLINITKPGDYTFSLSSDDGSQLEIDDTLVIDHDGIHPFGPKVGSIRLAEGAHPILIRMFESAGEESLRLEWKIPGSQSLTLVPREAFLTETGVTRVVSPGPKKYLDGRQNFRPGDGLVV
ncbi:MAG: PA14 domain-containing protein, partial [Planctomycetota bacterium]|nr:PA14 domain-containing protein [Planctomycetota bacterium]